MEAFETTDGRMCWWANYRRRRGAMSRKSCGSQRALGPAAAAAAEQQERWAAAAVVVVVVVVVVVGGCGLAKPTNSEQEMRDFYEVPVVVVGVVGVVGVAVGRKVR